MELWLQVLLAIALGTGIIAAAVFISFLIRIRRTLELAESGLGEFMRLLLEFRRSVLPAVQSLTSATQRFEKALQDLEPSFTNVKHFVATLATIMDHFHQVETRLYRRLIPPLEEATTVVVALLKAFSTFVRFLSPRDRSVSSEKGN